MIKISEEKYGWDLLPQELLMYQFVEQHYIIHRVQEATLGCNLLHMVIMNINYVKKVEVVENGINSVLYTVMCQFALYNKKEDIKEEGDLSLTDLKQFNNKSLYIL